MRVHALAAFGAPVPKTLRDNIDCVRVIHARPAHFKQLVLRHVVLEDQAMPTVSESAQHGYARVVFSTTVKANSAHGPCSKDKKGNVSSSTTLRPLAPETNFKFFAAALFLASSAR